MKEWLKRFHARSLQYANSKWSPWALLLISIADATIFPIPTTSFFIVISLLNTRKTLQFALFATLGTVIGAMAGYLVGRFACIDASGEFTGVIRFIFNNIPGVSHSGYEKIHLLFAKWNFWVLFLVTLTSIPYGIFSVVAGALNINMLVFFFSTLISQGIRFLFLALMTLGFGPKVHELMKFRHKLKLNPVAIITEVCVVAAMVLVRAF
jgi:membrane protein YqaA with SNARE-associated domain